jgi:hypothetical protein
VSLLTVQILQQILPADQISVLPDLLMAVGIRDPLRNRDGKLLAEFLTQPDNSKESG